MAQRCAGNSSLDQVFSKAGLVMSEIRLCSYNVELSIWSRKG